MKCNYWYAVAQGVVVAPESERPDRQTDAAEVSWLVSRRSTLFILSLLRPFRQANFSYDCGNFLFYLFYHKFLGFFYFHISQLNVFTLLSMECLHVEVYISDTGR